VDVLLRITRMDRPTSGDDAGDFQQFVASRECARCVQCLGAHACRARAGAQGVP
jgi:hypothetical protein